MSIKLGLLALLDEGPCHGYELKSQLEARSAGTWSVNVGQIYTTLARLERDGLVEAQLEDGEGRQPWVITSAGSEEVESWYSTPGLHLDRQRDELAIKIALAAANPRINTVDVLQAQRRNTMNLLQRYTTQKRLSADSDLAKTMVLDGLIFRAEAELRWLDHCEQRLEQLRPSINLSETNKEQ